MTTFHRRHRSRRVPHGLEAVHSTTSAEGNAILCFPPDGTFFRGLLNTRLDPSTEEESPYALYGRETQTPGQYKVTLADLETGTQYHLNSVQLRGKLRKTNNDLKLIAPQSIAIPIQNPKIISIQNSPNFDNIFLNESCPVFHEFHHEIRNEIKDDDILEDDENVIIGDSQSFEDGITSSFSDINTESSSPMNIEGLPKHFTHSLSDTTTSSSASPLSPNDIKDPQAPPQFSLESDEEQNVLQFTANSVYRGQKADMMIQQFMAGSKLVGSKCVVLVGPLRFCVNETPLMTGGNMAWSL